MNRKTLVIPAAVALALGIAGTASAHVPSSTATCAAGFTANAADYGAGADLTITVDGVAHTKHVNASGTLHIANPDQTVAHHYVITITAPDWAPYSDIGDLAPCTASTTTIASTTAPSTTLLPPTTSSTPTTVPPSSDETTTTSTPSTDATSTSTPASTSTTPDTGATTPPINSPADQIPQPPIGHRCIGIDPNTGTGTWSDTLQPCAIATDVVPPSNDQAVSPPPAGALPETGGHEAASIAPWAVAMVGFGVIACRIARRRVRT